MKMCGCVRLPSFLVVLVLASGLAVAGCDQKESGKVATVAVSPQPIGHAECAACGMVVREQPAPRMQVVHRDGHRAYFCSVGDSLHYLAEKNAHGAPAAVYVEAVESNMEPQQRETKEHPWISVSEAAFVTGVSRTGIMGEPVLALRTVSEAEELARRHSGAVATWQEVKGRLGE